MSEPCKCSNCSFFSGCGAGILLMLFSFLFSLMCGWELGRLWEQRNAVAAGAAEYYCPDGTKNQAEFRYKVSAP